MATQLKHRKRTAVSTSGPVDTEDVYERSDDPEQMKTLARVQDLMDSMKMRHNVRPSLKIVNEHKRLAQLKAEALREAEQLQVCIDVLETSEAFKEAQEIDSVRFST